jgi:serine/threonine-protein kinase RsbW
MNDLITVTIPSHPKYLSVVRAVTGKMAQLNGMDDLLIEDIKLAIDEACSNVIKHAYSGDTNKKIVLKYKTGEKGFKVIIEDNGMKARADLIKGRDLDDVRPGGLGIHFIRRVFDVFQFDENKKKGNRLILMKTLKKKK